jgi:Zn-dependent protease with chaperone function
VSPLTKSLAVVLAVPLLCAVLATSSRTQWDSRWQAGLRREALLRRQWLDAATLRRYSLEALCADPRTAASIRQCRPYAQLSSLARGGLAAAALGLAFLGGLVGVCRVCRSSRGRLARGFRTALHAAVAGVVLLVLLHGVLVLAVLFLVAEVVGRWPLSIFVGIGVVTLVAVFSIIEVALAFTRTAKAGVIGLRLDPLVQPALVARVSELADSLGATAPDTLLAGLSPGLFVTEVPIGFLGGTTSGRALYTSLPLARILSIDEWRALVAHELAHFAGEDLTLARRFYPAYAGALRAVEDLKAHARGLRSLAGWPALSVLSLFMAEIVGPRPLVAAQREAAADRAAASAVGAATLASALVKAHAFTPAWEVVVTAMTDAVESGTQYVNAGALFEHVARENAGPERLAGLGPLALSHPTDEHPALGARLAALGVSLSDVAAAALATGPAQPAVGLVSGSEEIERRLSEVEHRLLARQAG